MLSKSMQETLDKVKLEFVECLSDDEMLRLRNDTLYRIFMERAMREGLSKDEANSKMVIFLLHLKDEALQEKLDEMMRNPGKVMTDIDSYLRKG